VLLVVATGLLSWTGAGLSTPAPPEVPKEYFDPVEESPIQTIRRITSAYRSPDPDRSPIWTKSESELAARLPRGLVHWLLRRRTVAGFCEKV
jgi:hypothetical protein